LQKEKDLNQRPRLHWCTAGEFAHIPIHAAGIYNGDDQECCSDYVVSSYTPTLSTLLRARKGLQPIKTTGAKILLVTAKHTADALLPPLGKVEVETGDICSVVEKAGVQYAASSQSVSKTEEARAALPAANLVHIACHGLQHVSEPLKSAFHLSDHDVLSVSHLMELDLKDAFDTSAGVVYVRSFSHSTTSFSMSHLGSSGCVITVPRPSAPTHHDRKKKRTSVGALASLLRRPRL
jgi:CHAT domain-containing protein